MSISRHRISFWVLMLALIYGCAIAVDASANNGPPVATDDPAAATTPENTLVVTVNVLDNDILVDNAEITAYDFSSTNGGTVINNGNGTFTYMPTTDFSGQDAFSYTLTDDDGEFDSATVTVTVTVVNDGPPVAVDDPAAASTPENTATTTVDVLSNDTLVDNAVISAFDALSANAGSVANNGDGTFTYNPAPGYNGSDAFTYTLTDDDAESDIATVSVTVTPVNNGIPVALDDPLAAATARNTAVVTRNVLDNDTLLDHAILSDFDATSANGGTVVSNGGGTFTYIPASGFSGLDSFTYTLNDDEAETATATVTITVSDLPRGFLDVTLLPGVDPSGVTDSTQGLQDAIKLARDFSLSAFFLSGIYRVSDTLDLAQNTKLLSEPKPTGRIEGGIASQACVLIGSSLGSRPRIVLDDGSAGFDNPGSPKAVLYYRLNYQTANEAQDVVPNTFNNNGTTSQFGQGLRNMEIVTGNNPGAIGVHMAVAQRSFMEDVRVDATGALAGISGVPGRGMATVNVEITGGRFGFRLLSGSLGASLVGVVLRNQTENAIAWKTAVGLVVTGFRIEKTVGTGSAITTLGGNYRTGNLMLAHGIIETSSAGPAVDNSAGNYVYMKNVWVSGGTDVIQSATNPTVVASGGNWTRVEEYSHTRTSGNRPHFNLIDGIMHQNELVVTSPSTAPPLDLISRHVWSALPSFEDPGVINVLEAGATGDGITDDTDALQQAIDLSQNVFLPKGDYAISRPLRIHSDTHLFGVPGADRTDIHKAEGWNPAQPGWMIETDNEPDSAAYLGELDTNQEGNPFLGSVHWRLGQGSMLHNVRAGRIDESENVQMFRVSGHGGGRWYRFTYGTKTNQALPPNPGFRALLVDGVSQPLYLYGFNPEHLKVEPYIDIQASQNVFLFGGKTENNHGNFMQISDSRNVWVSQLGRHGIDPGEATFLVDNNTDVQITGVWPNDDGIIPGARYSILENDTGLSISGEASIGVYRRGTISDLAIPATISVPPLGQTVTVGEPASFSVVALGEPLLTYQWQKNGIDIAGATNESYITPTTSSADDGAAFTVVVSNVTGSAVSAPATLTVLEPVTISVDPSDKTVYHLEPVTFLVGATGTTPFAYQWQKNGADIPGATSSSYTIPQVSANDDGSTFRAVVTNTLGSASSASAALTVLIPSETPPTLINQPASITVTTGDTAMFSVNATGSLPLSYQWYRNGPEISGANASSYLIPETTQQDSGAYFWVVVSNANGTIVSDAAMLVVDNAPPRISAGPQVLYTFDEEGGTVVRDVSGVGSPLDLTITTPAATTWHPGRLEVGGSTTIVSSSAATKVINALQATNTLSIEAWMQPVNITQNGPARIVTLSSNTLLRDFTLGQDGSAYDVRLRTTSTSDNGIPSLSSAADSLTTTLTHVIYARDASGLAKLYINGAEQSSMVVAGDLSNWDSSHVFGLANELTGDRPWLGQLDLVAIYDHALSSAEVAQNFSAGPSINSDPEAVNDTFIVDENSSSNALDVLINDTDPDVGDNITITGAGVPDNGGLVAINASSNGLVYTPAVGFSGMDTFDYIINDGASIASATVSVTVTAVNNGVPVAVDDMNAAVTPENMTTITSSVLANDILLDNAMITAFDAISANDGDVVSNGDGTFTYMPAIDFNGDDTFSYTLTDDEGDFDSATVTVTVTAVNDGLPVAVDDPSAASTSLNTAVTTVNVLSNDTLVDNAAISAFDNLSVSGGSVADNGNGTFSYTPAIDFSGIDTFTYTLTDDEGEIDSASVTVTVTVMAPDADLAPWGAPDGQINVADLLIMVRIVLGEITATPLDLLHGDLYPTGEPDGVIDVSDLILLQQLILLNGIQ